MKLKFILIIKTIILFHVGCIVPQKTMQENIELKVGELFQKGSSCYTQCASGIVYEPLSGVFSIYTGKETINKNIYNELEVIIKPPTTEWCKRKADRNCMSVDPEDCLVWCLVEIPEEKETLRILLDTTEIKNFEVRNILPEQKYRIVKWEGLICDIDKTIIEIEDVEYKERESVEVLCNKKISKSLLNNLKDKLQGKGYFDEQVGKPLRFHLSKYQEDNNLPIGQLDIETMKALNIEIE